MRDRAKGAGARIEDDAKQTAAAREAGAVGEFGIVDEHGADAGDVVVIIQARLGKSHETAGRAVRGKI